MKLPSFVFGQPLAMSVKTTTEFDEKPDFFFFDAKYLFSGADCVLLKYYRLQLIPDQERCR